MHRLSCLVVIGAVAVAVSVVAAGPALAAKGGNNDNAHACQQGGHESRFEAETRRPFKNAGDCASHGAQGGDTSFVGIDSSGSSPCTNSSLTCWGTLSGSGLKPNTQWFVVLFHGATLTGTVGSDGTIPRRQAQHHLRPASVGPRGSDDIGGPGDHVAGGQRPLWLRHARVVDRLETHRPRHSTPTGEGPTPRPRIHRGHSQGDRPPAASLGIERIPGQMVRLSGPSARGRTSYVSKSLFHAGRKESGGAAQGT